MGRISIFSKLDLRDWQQPSQSHPGRATDDTILIQGGIEYTIDAEAGLHAKGGRMHTAFYTNIFTEDEDTWILFHLDFQSTADGIDHIDPGTLRVRRGCAKW